MSARTPVRVKTLTIDGREVGAREDQTILEVARENDIRIPTLCELTGLSNPGACRLCLVEVKGVPRLLPACVTHVSVSSNCCSRSAITSARCASATAIATCNRWRSLWA